MNTKENDLLDAEARLLGLGHEIYLLKLRIEEATPEVMSDCFAYVSQLSNQYQRVEAQLETLKEVTGEARGDLRDGVEQGLRELTDALESLGLYFRSQLGSNIWISI